MAQAWTNSVGQKAQKKSRSVPAVRRDRRELTGLGAAIGALVTEEAWELPASCASLRERWAPIAPNSLGTSPPCPTIRTPAGSPCARSHPEHLGRLPGVRVPDRNLALVGQSPSKFMLTKVALGAGGLLLPPLGTLPFLLLGMPFYLPVGVGLLFGAILWFAPDLALRDQARRAREEFAHAMAAYLDLVALRRAGNTSAEQAIKQAARAIADRPVSGWGRAREALAALAGEHRFNRGWYYRVAEMVRLALAVREAEGTDLLPEGFLRDLPGRGDAVRVVLLRAGLLAEASEPLRFYPADQPSTPYISPFRHPGRRSHRASAGTAMRGSPVAGEGSAATPASTGARSTPEAGACVAGARTYPRVAVTVAGATPIASSTRQGVTRREPRNSRSTCPPVLQQGFSH